MGMALRGPKESQTALSVCDSLHQQLQWGYGLRGLYIQVPATGETGIQRKLLGRLSIQARLLEGSILYGCRSLNSREWTSILFSQKGEQDEAFGAVCIPVGAPCVCV